MYVIYMHYPTIVVSDYALSDIFNMNTLLRHYLLLIHSAEHLIQRFILFLPFTRTVSLPCIWERLIVALSPVFHKTTCFILHYSSKPIEFNYFTNRNY
jgi:hypothetical protein